MPTCLSKCTIWFSGFWTGRASPGPRRSAAGAQPFLFLRVCVGVCNGDLTLAIIVAAGGAVRSPGARRPYLSGAVRPRAGRARPAARGGRRMGCFFPASRHGYGRPPPALRGAACRPSSPWTARRGAPRWTPSCRRVASPPLASLARLSLFIIMVFGGVRWLLRDPLPPLCEAAEDGLKL